MSNKIQTYLKSIGYTTAQDSTYDHIDEWMEWYQGEVKKFHKYKVFNGTMTKEHTRYAMGMAKKVCEDWANLIMNEKISIKAGSFDKSMEQILEKNNFAVRSNQLIEMTFSLGTGAFVEYLGADNEVMIDYIRADMIYPLSWDNGDVTECAFGATRILEGEEIIYLQIHRLGCPEDGEKGDEYYLENRYVAAESGKEIEPPEAIISLVPTNCKTPLFQIVTPNIANNIDLDSPLGISVYANCIPQLMGCDLIYDSYINEFILGRKRILVPITAAKLEMQKEGIAAPVFDPSDSVYYQMPGDRQDDFKLTEVDMTIRAQEHELGVQRSLDLLSLKAGMGTGRFQFDSSGVKTATEVISDKSDLYQNLRKNEIPIRTAIIGMVKATAHLSGADVKEVTVDFDDSIIEDSNTVIDKNIKLVTAGLKSKLSAIKDIMKCSDAEAKKELELISEDNQITAQDVDWTDTEDGEEDEKEDTANESTEKPTGSGSTNRDIPKS